MFHKTLPLKFNEFIPCFWEFTFGIETERPPLSEYGIFFSLYVFHIKLRLILFLDLYISMARNCKWLWWVFSLLSKAERFYYCVIIPFQLFAYLFLSRTSKLMDNRETDFVSLKKLRFWLFLMLEMFLVCWEHIGYNMLFYNIIDMFFKVQFWIKSDIE